MSFIGNAAGEVGKKAAQKGAQKGAEKATQKGAQAAAQKGAEKAAQKGTESAAKKSAESATQKAAEKGTQKLGDTSKSAAQKSLADQKNAQKAADKANPLGSSPKDALKEPKPKVEKTPDQKLEDQRNAEKKSTLGSKKDETKRDASGREVEDKPEGTKTLREKAKDAKKVSDERSREEEQTGKGKAKSIVRDVGGGAVAGAAGGAVAGAAAGGVGAAPGAAIGAVKGAATGIVKNKTTRKALIFLILSPLIVMAIVATFIFGAVQSALISSVSASEGGLDSTDLAVGSGIDQKDVDAAYSETGNSNYPWTLTLAWNEVMKTSKDESVKAFPENKFNAVMEEVDPPGNHRNMIYATEQNPEELGGGLVIPDDETTKKKQEEIKEVWVQAILKTGTPEGVEEGNADPVDAQKNGDNILVIGDSLASGASGVLNSRYGGIYIDASADRSMSSASSILDGLKSNGSMRPYIVLALGSTASAKDYLQTVYDKIGSEYGIVLVTGFATNPAEGEEARDTSWLEESNQSMKDFAEDHENVVVADWADKAKDHTDYIAEDGYNIATAEGYTLYSNTISDAINALPTMKTEPGITERQAEQIYDKAVALALGVGMDSCTANSTTGEDDGLGTAIGEKQKQHIITAMGVAKGMFPDNQQAARQAATIALMTMSVETGFNNYANSGVPFSLTLDHDAVGSDHDSVGLMQQRVSGSWGAAGDSTWSSDPNGVVTRLMTPDFAIGKFIQVLSTKDNWLNGNKGELAQDVQVSAYPDRYAEKESEANSLMAQYYDSAPSIAPNAALGWNGAEIDPSTINSGQGCGSLLGEGTMGVGALPVPEGTASLSSLYGPRDCSDGISSCFHRGVDLAGFGGTSGNNCVADIPIYSISNGVVEEAPAPGYGANNAIVIKYSEQLKFYYLHSSTSDFKVKVGDNVTAGQQITSMGSYGASTGCHLHIETHVDGEKVDPLPIIEQGFGVTLPR